MGLCTRGNKTIRGIDNIGKKLCFLLYDKSLQFKQPSFILDLLKIQPTHSTCSSAVVTLQRPSNPSRLKIYADRFFYHQAPALWNSLPKHLHTLSSTSPTQTNYSLLSIPQTTENLPLPSILSSLDHLFSGLTLWNSAWFTHHSHFVQFIIHQRITHHVGIFINTWCPECTGISWQKFISVSSMVHFKSSSFSHIINLTSFHHIFVVVVDHLWTIVSYWELY